MSNALISAVFYGYITLRKVNSKMSHKKTQDKIYSIFVFLDAEGKTKEEILLKIAVFAKQRRLINNERYLYQKLIERENAASTAIGKGIALPQACWIRMSRPYAFILCRTKEPVDFNSSDGLPVRIILASLGRDKWDSSRFRPMAHLVKFLKSSIYRKRFLGVKTKEEVYLLLEELT